ncbi:NAD(P)-dependent oxidoreductase [Geminicoccus flavidas]|uniref:NAD(P)-dependent oxidoreductase n=1 Tax=Geminicoccus flavidas TaxID=2506407 RepID=UPI00135A3469|nr:NAD(P)-dependent oxidoreductase [Geminicoccus flavidas]
MHALLVYQSDRWLDSRLEQLPFPVEAVTPADKPGVLAAMARTDVLLHALDPVTKAHIEAGSKLKLIQKIGVGVNTIDLETAKSRGIAVCNMPGTNTVAVAEQALLLMLSVLRRVTVQDRASRQGQGWSDEIQAAGAYGELAGRSVGFVGFGAVPRRLAPIIEAMGGKVLRWHRSDAEGQPGQRIEVLEDLFARADIISLHLPLLPDTAKIVNADTLGHVRSGTILVNTARGGLIDEPALIAALDDGRLAGAGLDVLTTEPFEPANPLLARDDVVLAPHSAWLTRETWDRSLAVIVENVRRVESGEPLLHRVV